MKDVIPVYYGDIIVGSITPEPDITFTYSNKWLARNSNFPVSLSMPLSTQSYGHSLVTPWLMNLLPEGDPLAAADRALGVSTEDVIEMLSRIGQDVAGALSVGRIPRSCAAVRRTRCSGQNAHGYASAPSDRYVGAGRPVGMSRPGTPVQRPARPGTASRLAIHADVRG